MSEPGTLVLFAVMTAVLITWVAVMAWTAREPAVRPQRSRQGRLDEHQAWWAREHFVADAWRRTGDPSPRHD